MSGDSVTVYGGAAGDIACMEDLGLLVMQLKWAREEVARADQAAIRAGGLDLSLAERLWPYWAMAGCSPGEKTARWLAAEIGDGLRTAIGTAVLLDELDQLAVNLLRAKAAYDEADQEIGRLFGSSASFDWVSALPPLPWPLGAMTRTVALAGGVAADTGAGILLDGHPPSWAELLRSRHDQVRGLLGSMIVPFPLFTTPSTDQLTRTATAVATLGHGDGLSVTVTRGSAAADRPPAGVEDLVWRVKALADADKSDSQIGVTKVSAADGSASWLVTVPGTQSMALGTGSNPADMGTNLRAVPGDTNAIGLAAVAAMADAGVQPGEPVVLAGHSQGGIVAAALAADPEFTAQYALAAVLTIGSPVSRLKPSNSAQWLSLEHTQDIIPALSGGANQRGPTQTTVVRDLREASDPDLREAATDTAAAHHLETYADTARILDQGSDQSVAAWRDAAAPVLDPTASAETTVYKVKRE
ncbi:MAG: DUF3089 domain-containing protein [Bifidobacteriaceae bacterium]|nr:DUF3089 domain-containing protein [Bifidobacteriaceae bacterium]